MATICFQIFFLYDQKKINHITIAKWKENARNEKAREKKYKLIKKGNSKSF
jgi:hypothetical protein